MKRIDYQSENIERLFNDEVREKKKVGRGSFHKRGKGVKHGLSGALKTPYYYMNKKEREKLNGEVEVFYMDKNKVLTIAEFEKNEIEKQKELLVHWRSIYKTKDIMEKMGLTNTLFYMLMDKLEIPRSNRGGAHNTKAKRIEKEKEKTIAVSAEKKEKPPVTKEAPIAKILTNGLHLEFNGSYDPDSLNKLFTKLQLLIDGEDNEYQIYLTLSEKQPN